MLASWARAQGPCSAALLSRLAPAAAAALQAACGGAPCRAVAAAAAAGAPAAAWQQRFEGVAPGSVLRFDLPGDEAHLDVRVGEHEAVELSSEHPLAAQQADHAGHPGSSLVTVSAPGAGMPAAPLRLRARGPSRFLTVEAITGGGSVSVEVVQEGSLRLSTSGGGVSVPKVKAFDAHVSSGGGAVTGALTGVDVRVASGGGAVQLKSLVGKRAAVDSGGGPLTLGACYADRLDLDSGGGPIHITNMDCREGAAVLRSRGGGVTIDSLDGPCHIQSQGGDVQIQLHDNAGAVTVESGGGGIQLFLSPGAAGSLRLRNCGRVAARPGTVRLAQPQDDGSLLLSLPLGTQGAPAGSAPAAAGLGGAAGSAAPPPPLSRLQRAGRPPPPGNAVTTASRGQQCGAEILLDAGGTGTVSIVERGWMDALRHKFGGQ